MYQPEVNDYVKWKVKLGQDLEGWVYFKSSDYITIEISTKPSPLCDLSTFKHKTIHTCILCFPQDYKDLTYVATRPSIHDGLENSKDRFNGQEDQRLHREMEKEVTNA